MVYIFISYSHRDRDFRVKLETDLRSSGIRLWVDERLRGGDFWDDEVEKILSDADLTHVLVLVSAHSMQSENVMNEIRFAINEGKLIVPLVISDYGKRRLIMGTRLEIDFREDYSKGLDKLLRDLSNYGPPSYRKKENTPSDQPILKLTSEQKRAAHDPSRLIRLIAAPGTGKSFVIEERVWWLLSKGVDPQKIAVVSFTRAASRDLKQRIISRCRQNGLPNGDEVSVTTLHSRAMKVLRKAGKLHYPADPQVLDEWELDKIFDVEFSETKRTASPDLSGLTPKRAREIRLAVEAQWNTGQWNPPNYIPPDNPVTDAEKEAFQQFHHPTTQVYSCVLPGEIVKKCVDGIERGTLDPVEELEIQNLIIDEYQDLNYTDQQFIAAFIRQNVNIFIAGDADQSIYSFRYAYPTGIQEFASKYSGVSNHSLVECFRCTPYILETSQELIRNYQSPGRIPKTVESFCIDLEPRLDGKVYRWRLKSEHAEYEAIAQSCKALVERGMKPRNILILISNRDALVPGVPSVLEQKFADPDISLPLEMPTGKRYIDTNPGRLAYGLVRIACDMNSQDYVAHRIILGLHHGVGPKIRNGIREKVSAFNLNYIDLFYQPIPEGVFTTLEKSSLNKVREVCKKLQEWKPQDRIVDRKQEIAQIINDNCDENADQEWLEHIAHLPDDMNIKELRSYLSTDNSEQQEALLREVYERLELDIPEEGLLPQQIRVMTMHGAKGLNADVVFIPGLEDDILPGKKKARYPGLVQESARQLYVSATRARLACIFTYANSRRVHGDWEYDRTPSRYDDHLNGRFFPRDNGLTDGEADEIIESGAVFRTHTQKRIAAL